MHTQHGWRSLTTAEERHLKLYNVVKHRMTLGETLNYVIERREQERYFACRTRLTGKHCNQGRILFKFMVEIDWLAADLHRLGDRSVTGLRKRVINLAGLSADYEIEVQMLESNPAGLDRAEIERAIGRRGDRATDSRTTASTAGEGVPTLRIAEALIRRSKNQEMSPPAKRAEVGGKCYVCGSEEHFAHKHCNLCRNLRHRTRDCEERGAEKGAMLVKINVPSNPEVGLVVAMTCAARGDGKEK